MRKICVVIGSRANYSSIKSAMYAIQNHPDLELQVVAGASALLDRYGSIVDTIEKDGFHPHQCETNGRRDRRQTLIETQFG